MGFNPKQLLLAGLRRGRSLPLSVTAFRVGAAAQRFQGFVVWGFEGVRNTSVCYFFVAALSEPTCISQ